MIGYICLTLCNKNDLWCICKQDIRLFLSFIFEIQQNVASKVGRETFVRTEQ